MIQNRKIEQQAYHQIQMDMLYDNMDHNPFHH